MSSSPSMVESEQLDLKLEGLSCAACVATIERALNSVPGVTATVNFATESAHAIAPIGTNIKTLITAVEKSGYGASELKGELASFGNSRKLAWRLFITALLAIPTLAIALSSSWQRWLDDSLPNQIHSWVTSADHVAPSQWMMIFLTAPIVVFLAWPIHRAGIRNLLHPTMDTLISIGSLTAFGWSIYAILELGAHTYTEVAAGVLLFTILGRYLEARAKRKGGSALAQLLRLGAKEVIILRNGTEITESISVLKVGDNFVVKPGDQIATDGIVIMGDSDVNNAFLTGESLPLRISAGAKVYGGALNTSGRLIVEATKVGADTELARITKMVLTAQTEKAPIQQVADRISAVFVPIVLLIALGTGIGWYMYNSMAAMALSHSIAVLVIACPCALGLAAPIALLVTSGRGAQLGIIFRSPRTIEIAEKIDQVVFDKTGTLTTGQMNVRSALFADPSTLIPSLPAGALPQIAEIIEAADSHPIAHAIVEYIRQERGSRSPLIPLAISEFEATPGLGVAARVELKDSTKYAVLLGSAASIAKRTIPFSPQIIELIERASQSGNTSVVLAVDGIALAAFEVGDELRADSALTVGELRKRGIAVWMLTGDRSDSAQFMATKAGISPESIIDTALPEQKAAHITSLQHQGHRVLMVGDGVNDAAAMAHADLSMAMGTGTDTAMASADITLLGNRLNSVISAIDLGKRTIKTIRINMRWALIYNVIGIPLAALGELKPIYCSIAMALSSLLVSLNSLRIARFSPLV